MRFISLLPLCVFAFAHPGPRGNTPASPEKEPSLFARDQALQPSTRDNSSTTPRLTSDEHHDPLCYSHQDQRQRNEVGMEQCMPIINALLAEHDVDVWLNPGRRFEKHYRSCFITVYGRAKQEGNPYVGATYQDIAEMMTTVLSICRGTRDRIGRPRFGKGGRVKVGKMGEDWLGFWLDIEGQPPMWRTPSLLDSPRTMSNITSVDDATT